MGAGIFMGCWSAVMFLQIRILAAQELQRLLVESLMSVSKSLQISCGLRPTNMSR